MRLVFCIFPVCLLALLGALFWPAESWSFQRFTLDGRFDDWKGQAFIADGDGDALANGDFRSLSWGTNENERKLYFMVERYAPADASSSLCCRLYFDVNCTGRYEDGVDRFAELAYSPGKGKNGEVTVKVYSVAGSLLAAYHGMWGEGRKEGGRRFEFFVSMGTIGVYPAQPIRFYLSGIGANVDRVPDKNDNQWAPFPVYTKNRRNIAVGFVIWLGITVFFRRYRVWPFYFIWGAVGFTFVLILLLRGTFLEYQMEYQTGLLLHHFFKLFDVTTYVFDKAPGTLLVLIKIDSSWTTIDIDIESSGLLETCILLGLVLFFPAFNLLEKTLFSFAGVCAVYAINLLRLVLVISMIHWGGRSLNFVSHTLLGRLLFFALVIALYWRIFTKPSLKKVRENVEVA